MKASLLNLRFPIYLLRSFEKFYRDMGSFQAATLTFYTLFALVPFLGLMFGIAQGFGFEKKLQEILHNLLSGQEEIYKNLITFTNNLLAQTKEEWIAGAGLVILLWSVYKVLRVLEQIFNHMWSVTPSKNSWIRAQHLASLLLLAPIALVILAGVLIEGLNAAQHYLPVGALPIPSAWLLSQTSVVLIVMVTLLFGLSYWALPSVRIPLWPALGAGFLASLLFHGLQSVYWIFQSSITQYGVIYGSFASVPLFMMWVYFSWVIYLLGAELTYIIESRITHRWELQLQAIPIRLQRVLAMEIMDTIKQRFEGGEAPLNTQEMADKLSISKALTRKMLDLLKSADLITTVSSAHKTGPCFIPNKGLKWLNQDYVMNALEATGWLSPYSNDKHIKTIIQAFEHRNHRSHQDK